MNSKRGVHAVWWILGFGAGLAAAHLPGVHAEAATVPATDLSHKHFIVSIDEIRKNFVFADAFQGHYTKTVTLSDGSKRTIELIPTMHNGMQVAALKDNGGLTYMGLNGTTTNGTLMIQLRDLDTMRAQLKKEGWHQRAPR